MAEIRNLNELPVTEWKLKEWYVVDKDTLNKIDLEDVKKLTQEEQENIKDMLLIRKDNESVPATVKVIEKIINFLESTNFSIDQVNEIQKMTPEEIKGKDENFIKKIGFALWEFGDIRLLNAVSHEQMYYYDFSEIERIYRIFKRRFFGGKQTKFDRETTKIFNSTYTKVHKFYLTKKRSLLKDIVIDNEVYISDQSFFSKIGYTHPSLKTKSDFQKLFNAQKANGTYYYSKKMIIDFLNKNYEYPERGKVLTDIPVLLTAGDIKEILELKKPSHKTFRKIGGYHLRTSEEQELVTRGVKTVYDVEDVKEYIKETIGYTIFRNYKTQEEEFNEAFNTKLETILASR